MYKWETVLTETQLSFLTKEFYITYLHYTIVYYYYNNTRIIPKMIHIAKTHLVVYIMFYVLYNEINAVKKNINKPIISMLEASIFVYCISMEKQVQFHILQADDKN